MGAQVKGHSSPGTTSARAVGPNTAPHTTTAHAAASRLRQRTSAPSLTRSPGSDRRGVRLRGAPQALSDVDGGRKAQEAPRLLDVGLRVRDVALAEGLEPRRRPRDAPQPDDGVG